jgi:hypothetical protein
MHDMPSALLVQTGCVTRAVCLTNAESLAMLSRVASSAGPRLLRVEQLIAYADAALSA